MTRVGTGFWYLTEVSVKSDSEVYNSHNTRIVKWVPSWEVLPPSIHCMDKPMPGHALHDGEKDKGKNSESEKGSHCKVEERDENPGVEERDVVSQ